MTRRALLSLSALALPARAQVRPGELTIGISDQTGFLDDRTLRAIQHQIDYDFAPIWHRPARLVVGIGQWNVTITWTSPEPGTYGFHSSDTSGNPYSIVGVQAPWSWTRVLSHEVMEMLVNPWAAAALGPKGYVPYECCDPVELNSYTVDGIEVSDFVYPGWFLACGSGKLDHLGVLTTSLWRP